VKIFSTDELSSGKDTERNSISATSNWQLAKPKLADVNSIRHDRVPSPAHQIFKISKA
jgi:hypothetical protein